MTLCKIKTVRWRRRAFSLAEVMVAAAFFMICSAGIFSTYTMSLKAQRRASYHVIMYAFANSINDQVCGLGYTEVDAALAANTKAVLAINNPVDGKLIQVALRFNNRFAFDSSGVDASGNKTDIRLKTDYTMHGGLDSKSPDGTFSMTDLAAGRGTYSTVKNLGALIQARKVAPTVPAYLVTTTVDYNDGDKISQVTVSRVVSNINGCSNAR